MRKIVIRSIGFIIAFMVTAWGLSSLASIASFSDDEADFNSEDSKQFEKVPLLFKAKPEDSVPRVGIQIGHWKNDEVPRELWPLEKSGVGAVGGGTSEREIMLSIGKKVAILLELKGITVDLLPATVPPAYTADAFIALHADGNPNTAVSGFKLASPFIDYSGKSVQLEKALYASYERATGLDKDENITKRMRGYYAFNWRNYKHAIHPLTPAVILETGFITNPHDQTILIQHQDKAVKGIVEGVLDFLNLE